MKEEIAVRKNLDLLNEFMKYSFDHPDILDNIPPDAELVILPENDPELLEENMKILAKLRKEEKPIVIVRMKMPETIPEPKIEVLAG